MAAVSSDEKAAAAKQAGADETIVYARAPFDKAQSKALADQFKAAGGKSGFDAIYDPSVAIMPSRRFGRSVGRGGIWSWIPAGIPRLPLNLTLLKSCDVCGVFWGAFAARDPKANAAHMDHLFRLWEREKIAPRVTETFPLARVAMRSRRWRRAVRSGSWWVEEVGG